ncbi:MAG: hypothetical protein OJF50_005929 [Nitrospira sp.]|nr:hypothetical protein [Nitrospira sp.]
MSTILACRHNQNLYRRIKRLVTLTNRLHEGTSLRTVFYTLPSHSASCRNPMRDDLLKYLSLGEI